MSESNQSESRFAGVVPKSIVGRIGIVAALLLAFLLGSMLTGNSDRSAHDHGAETESAAPTVWTCSMHPQIQLPKMGKCPICFMDLIPLEAETGPELGPRQLRMTESAIQNARIVTAEAQLGFAQAEIGLTGRLTYDETREAYITAWVSGRLDHLYADFTGVRVNEGDHMVEIYSPKMIAAQEELLQAGQAITALAKGSSLLKETARKTLDASRRKLRLAGLSDAQILEIEETETVSEFLTINAPIGGVVVHKNATEGMYVETGARIYTIADLSQLWVMFDAYESDLLWLRYGQSVEFTTQAYPGETFSAQIVFIDPTLDQRTRTIRVRAVFDNNSGKLKPDMLVSGHVHSRINSAGEVVDETFAGKWIGPMHPQIVKDEAGECDVCGMDLVSAESLGYSNSTTSESSAILIPATAPLLTGQRAIVYVELPDTEEPIFEGRVVELGPRAGDMYVVKSGIEEGERVVVNGAFKLDAELQIRAKPSMMSAPEIKPKESSSEEENFIVTTEARSALTPLYQAYFKVQAALAADGGADAIALYTPLSAAISSVDMALFAGPAHMRWMKLAKRLSAYSADGEKASDIEAARLAFYGLSKALIELHESFGHTDDQNFYLTYCPMAMNNTGAFWMQTVDTVYNAFYGASMLRCGSIEDTLQPEH